MIKRSQVSVSAGEFFSRANFLHSFEYLFHPHVTAAACKRSRSFCQKCRWQVTAKHACILRMWLWIKWHCKLVHVAPRWQQFYMGHQPVTTKEHCKCKHFVGYIIIFKMRCVKLQSLIQCRTWLECRHRDDCAFVAIVVKCLVLILRWGT